MLKKILKKLHQFNEINFKIDTLNNNVEKLKTNFLQTNNIESKLDQSSKQIFNINNNFDEQKILMAKSVLLQQKSLKSKNIQDYEFKVFSQWGDDGIIQFLVNYLNIDQKIFIEFGVENYKEANTRFLLINNNWSGLVMDGSKVNMSQLQNEDIYWRYNIKGKQLFITKDNINNAIKSEGISGEIGLLHIDIDGNDYWVWKEISVVSPVITIVEYNSVFGKDHPWTVPYDKNFNRTKKHYSNLYFGSSLLSLCDLAKEKGYIYIGCNSNGNNAYFIRKDKIKDLISLKPEAGFVSSQFRESRDVNGKLTYISGIKRIKTIEGMPIFNTRSLKLEKINEK